MANRSDQDGPPMVFDGKIFWYREYFDPADDRCCVCRELLNEEEIPLIIFRTVGADPRDRDAGADLETHMARLHFDPCGQPFLRRAVLGKR